MEPKKCLTKKEQSNHWLQLYLQAKTSGDKKKMKLYEAILLKIGVAIPKL
jgi:hypothetical protein